MKVRSWLCKAALAHTPCAVLPLISQTHPGPWRGLTVEGSRSFPQAAGQGEELLLRGTKRSPGEGPQLCSVSCPPPLGHLTEDPSPPAPRGGAWDLLLQTDLGACVCHSSLFLLGHEGKLSWASQQLPCRRGAAGKATFLHRSVNRVWPGPSIHLSFTPAQGALGDQPMTLAGKVARRKAQGNGVPSELQRPGGCRR